jgi:hypothetical protein
MISVGGSLGLAQQDANNTKPQGQPLMTLASDTREALVNKLHLNVYGVITGDVSSCAEDKECVRQMTDFKLLVCAANICDGTDKSKKPLDCFPKISGQYTQEALDQINSLACSVIVSPGVATRKALLKYMVHIEERSLVKSVAYLLAVKGSAMVCESYIKDYVGSYGPQWNSQWYRALSGCRILAGERTVSQEEKDFYTWFGVIQGLGSCSDIFNSDMRHACNAPGAASPVPSSVGLQVQSK